MQPVYYLEMTETVADPMSMEQGSFIREEVVDKAEAITKKNDYASDPDYFQGLTFTAGFHSHYHNPNSPCTMETI